MRDSLDRALTATLWVSATVAVVGTVVCIAAQVVML
jgi:hypothetical protein